MTEQTEQTAQIDRLETIGKQMNAIISEVGPKLIMLSHLREEARKIMGELREKQRQ